MKYLLVLAVLLSGCATSQGFDTRIYCSLPGDQLLVSSWWKFFAITTKASTKDRDIICAEKKKKK